MPALASVDAVVARLQAHLDALAASPKMSAEAKRIAAERRPATRTLRGTTSKKQKRALKGGR